METPYGLSVDTTLPFDEAVEKTRAALKAEGFGVLTEIDVKATLKAKLDVDFRRYVILGACNPPFAYKALSLERDIGLLLPCNVIVYERDDSEATVSAIDAEAAMQMTGNQRLEEVAREVGTRLKRVLASISS
jgi:uncharacterized protein (DUF302 family)